MYMSYQNKCCAVEIITKMKYKHKMLNISFHASVIGSKRNMYEKYEYNRVLLGIYRFNIELILPRNYGK